MVIMCGVSITGSRIILKSNNHFSCKFFATLRSVYLRNFHTLIGMPFMDEKNESMPSIIVPYI